MVKNRRKNIKISKKYGLTKKFLASPYKMSPIWSALLGGVGGSIIFVQQRQLRVAGRGFEPPTSSL